MPALTLGGGFLADQLAERALILPDRLTTQRGGGGTILGMPEEFSRVPTWLRQARRVLLARDTGRGSADGPSSRG